MDEPASNLMEFSNLMGVLMRKTGEVAYRMGFIDKAQLMTLAEPLAKSGYGQYLQRQK